MEKIYVDLFQKYPVLKKINNDNNGVLERRALIKKYEADSIMVSANGDCEGVLFVLKGEVNISRLTEDGNEMKLYSLKPGQLCHEALSCLLQYVPMNIVGRLIEDSIVIVIPTDIMRKYCLFDSVFLSFMYQDLYQKMNYIIEAREEKSYESLDNRLLKFLRSANSKNIYKTHKEIAYEIDASRESISRKLKQFERKGILTMERGCIHMEER